MADLNFTALSGSVERWKHTPPSGAKKWHDFWVLTRLDNTQVQLDDKLVVIEEQKLFFGIKVGDSDYQQKALAAVKNVLGQQVGAYFLLTNGTLSSYFSKKKNAEVYKLDVSLSNFRAFNEPKHPENIVVLCGKVTSVSPGWIQVEESYRNPRGEGKDAWKSRKIWVYTTVTMDLQTGAPVYVRGRLANKRPDGQEMMYVIAEKIS